MSRLNYYFGFLMHAFVAAGGAAVLALKATACSLAEYNVLSTLLSRLPTFGTTFPFICCRLEDALSLSGTEG